jgi:hypothetical protein
MYIFILFSANLPRQSSYRTVNGGSGDVSESYGESYGGESYGSESYGDSYGESYGEESYGSESYGDSYGSESYGDSYGESYGEESYGSESYGEESYGDESSPTTTSAPTSGELVKQWIVLPRPSLTLLKFQKSQMINDINGMN